MSSIHPTPSNNGSGSITSGNNVAGGAIMNLGSQAQHNVPGVGAHQYLNGNGPPGVISSGAGNITSNHNNNNTSAIIGSGGGNNVIVGASIGNTANAGMNGSNGIPVIGGGNGGTNNVNNINGNGVATSASGLHTVPLVANTSTANGMQMNSMGTVIGSGGSNGVTAQMNGTMAGYNNGMTNVAAATAAVAVAASARHHPVSTTEGLEGDQFNTLGGTFSTAPKLLVKLRR